MKNAKLDLSNEFHTDVERILIRGCDGTPADAVQSILKNYE